jgi:hypothetical protein
VKIFVGGEPLREQLRTAHRPIGIQNQAAISFVVEQGLRDSEDHEGIKTAANNRQNQCGEDRAANFREKFFHRLNEMERSDHHVDKLDADEWQDDAAEPIDEQVALKNCKRANRFVGNTTQRQGN